MTISLSTIMLIILIIFSVALYLMVKKEVPLLIKRKRAEWEDEIKRKEIKKNHFQKHEDEIQAVVKEEKRKLFKENRKERYKQHLTNSSQKGRAYELFITDYFAKQGYQTKPFGILHGKKDKGIDVIIKKNKEITLIQCKNWKANSRYKIRHIELKEFLGNTTAFLDKYKDRAEGYTIKRLFVTSNDVLDDSARYFLRDNSIVEYVVIPMN